jgi:molecular chaperone GrpE (heat shock protein)
MPHPLTILPYMNQTEPKLSKVPFIIGDVILVVLAYFVYHQSSRPMTTWQMAFFVLCGALGAWISVLPFLIEYRASLKTSDTNALSNAVTQIQNVEQVAQRISAATAQWQTVQEQSAKTAATANEVVDRIGAEARSFTEFLQRANDGEKAHLRLEIEKLKRSEGEWLQIIIRMLDHTYALHQAAVRSGQPGLIEQLGNFQNACRDVARRTGLVPFVANPGDPFDQNFHQLADQNAQIQMDSKVGEVIATGYTFQGQLLRPALVTLQTQIFEQVPPAMEETPVVTETAILEEAPAHPPAAETAFTEAAITETAVAETPIAETTFTETAILEEAPAPIAEVPEPEASPVIEEPENISIKELLLRKEPAEQEPVIKPVNGKFEEQTLL